MASTRIPPARPPWRRRTHALLAVFIFGIVASASADITMAATLPPPITTRPGHAARPAQPCRYTFASKETPQQ